MNEFDFIRKLRELTASRNRSTRVITSIGDDGSVIRQSADHDLVVTTDLLVEEIDFHRAAIPPRLLGHKALAVSLSDIAAMGARPVCSLVSIGLPGVVWLSDFKDEFFAGYPSFARINPIASWLRFWGKAPKSMRDVAAGAVKVLLGPSVRGVKAAEILRGHEQIQWIVIGDGSARPVEDPAAGKDRPHAA